MVVSYIVTDSYKQEHRLHRVKLYSPRHAVTCHNITITNSISCVTRQWFSHASTLPNVSSHTSNIDSRKLMTHTTSPDSKPLLYILGNPITSLISNMLNQWRITYHHYMSSKLNRFILRSDLCKQTSAQQFSYLARPINATNKLTS